MFKRIHSNRDPNDTLFSEIKKEFGAYFGKAESCSKVIMERHAKVIFMFMVGILIISIALSFTVFRHPDVPPKSFIKANVPLATSTQPAVLSDGFSRIMQVGSALREMITLKKRVDSITSKKALTRQDSIILEKDLDRLQQINNPKNKTNGH